MESDQNNAFDKLLRVGILFLAYKAVEEQWEHFRASGDRGELERFCSDLSQVLDSQGHKSSECLVTTTQTEDAQLSVTMQLNDQQMILPPIAMSNADSVPELKYKGQVRSLNAFLASIHNASPTV